MQVQIRSADATLSYVSDLHTLLKAVMFALLFALMCAQSSNVCTSVICTEVCTHAKHPFYSFSTGAGKRPSFQGRLHRQFQPHWRQHYLRRTTAPSHSMQQNNREAVKYHSGDFFRLGCTHRPQPLLKIKSAK